MLIGQLENEDLYYMTITHVFYIGAGQCESLDVALERLTFLLDHRPKAHHITSLPFVG